MKPSLRYGILVVQVRVAKGIQTKSRNTLIRPVDLLPELL